MNVQIFALVVMAVIGVSGILLAGGNMAIVIQVVTLVAPTTAALLVLLRVNHANEKLDTATVKLNENTARTEQNLEKTEQNLEKTTELSVQVDGRLTKLLEQMQKAADTAEKAALFAGLAAGRAEAKIEAKELVAAVVAEIQKPPA